MRAFAAVIAAIAAAGSSYGSLAQAPAFTRFRHHHGYDPLPVPSRPLNQERLDKAFADERSATDTAYRAWAAPVVRLVLRRAA